MNRNYALKRIIEIPITLLGITLLAYVIACLAPGSPLDMMTDPDVRPEEIEAARIRMGLDKPIIIQYLYWLKNVFMLNLGTSYRTRKAVSGMIGECIAPTLLLTVSSVVIALAVSIFIGIKAGLKPKGFWNEIANVFSFITSAVPSFFFALILIYIFAVRLKLLPTNGMYDNAMDVRFGSLIRHLILPLSVLTMTQIGDLIKQTRAAVIEVLKEDYIKTARAKGLPFGRILRKHVIKNSMAPIVTVLGMKLKFIFGGAVVTEQIFNWPGIGKLLVSSISSRDYPTIMGIVLLIATAVLIGNFILDIIYGLLDPQITY